MKLEAQVVSLDLAKRLKELGVRQESHFIWKNGSDKQEGWYVDRRDEQFPYECSAFTVAELGEMLPDGHRSGRTKPGAYVCYKQNDIDGLSLFSATEADARAKMAIYLLEKQLIS